jgi:hypothetical protein
LKGRIAVADFLFDRVGVVETENHLAVVFVGKVTVEKSSLGVTDVEVTRGLGG